MESVIITRKPGLGLKRMCLFVAVSSLALPSLAQAQTAAPTREELNRPGIEAELRGDPSSVSVEGEIERAPCPLAAPQFEELTFTFNRAEFAGLSGVDAGLLDASWADYVGQEISVATICDIRDRAATALRLARAL